MAGRVAQAAIGAGPMTLSDLNVRQILGAKRARADCRCRIRQDCIDRRHVINGEDVAIVERLQIGRRSPAMMGGVFSAALEDTTHNFQKTFLMRLQAAGAVG